MPTRLLRLLSLSLFALLVVAAPAGAGFAPTNELIVEAEQLSATGFDSDAQGNSLAAWSQQKVLGAPFEVKARRVTATGAVGPLIELAPGLIGYRPTVAMTPAGRAFVAWRELLDSEPDSVKGRWVESDGALGPILTLAKGEAGVEEALNPMAVVAPSGVVTVAWENEEKNTFELRRVSPDSTLGPLVEDVADGSVTNAVIAALPNGSTVAVWRSSGTEKNVVTAANAVGAVEQISETSIAGDNEIATDAAGNSLVVWRQSGAEYAVRGRLLDPNGLPVGPELTFDPLEPGFVGSRPNVSADSVGNFLVTWTRQIAGINTMYARGWNRAGGFAGPKQLVSSPGIGAFDAFPALLDGGVGALAWRGDLPEDPVVGRPVNGLGAPTGPVAPLFSDGFGPERVSSAPAAGIAAFTIGYAISGSAQGVVVRRFMVPPTCTGSAATVVQGSPVSAPISCTGPALEGARLISQARHGIVSAFSPFVNGFVYTPLPGYEGTDSFTYAGLNDGGESAATEVTIAVGKETVKPRVKKLRFIRKGKKFRLVLSEPAKAVIRVKTVKRIDGRRRIKLIGKITRLQAPVRSTIKVRGKLARKLAAGGKFRAIAVATDLARNKSKPKRIAFRVGG
ncbi:MAG TPA: hypothetical protein VFZ19_00980 [Solirubrobacterales bacterium]